MFKLMIADDNPFVLRALCDFTDWEDYDLYIVGTFPNGKKLLEAAHANMPDVIITDISMPVMDGIALASAIRQLSSDVKIIFISSYADFQHAQKALSMQISGYILKPFEPEQLTEIMNRVLNELRQESFRRFEYDRSLHQIETLRSIALENYMSELLYHSKDNSLVRAQLKELQVALFPSYTLQVASISLHSGDTSNYSYKETNNRIRSILSSYPDQEYRLILMPVDTKSIAILLLRSSACPDTADLLAQLSVDIEIITGMHTTVGYSKSSDNFAALPDLYAQAKASNAASSQASIVGYEDIHTENIPRRNHSTSSRNHVRKMKEYIQAHFTEPITTHDVASAAFLSPRYANHCFNSECGCSIFDFITQSRINEARRLLVETDEQITMIAELVGYNGKTNFYLAFKKNVGMSPAQYRRANTE